MEIEQKMAELQQEMDKLSKHWNDTTEGVHLNDRGEVVDARGRLIRTTTTVTTETVTDSMVVRKQSAGLQLHAAPPPPHTGNARWDSLMRQLKEVTHSMLYLTFAHYVPSFILCVQTCFEGCIVILWVGVHYDIGFIGQEFI
jgi:hypothetical protein